MANADILIIGGGPAGLTTAGALKQAGLESTILDSGERIGQSWEKRYDRLHLHTVRAYSGLAHFPIPREYPRYLSKDQYAGYLREYASHFDLNFVPNTTVRRVHPARANGHTGWAVESENGQRFARVVVIATGPFGQLVTPVWPEIARYRGKMLHSAEYRSGIDFQHQRVLVIGTGNSGMEIAVDLVEQGAASVTISVRACPPVVPRDFLGVPAQVFGIWMNALPPSVSDRVGNVLSRIALGDLRRYGLSSPGWMPFRSHRTPVIDVGIVRALKAGKVRVRPAVRSFTSTGVIFEESHDENASSEDFDAVIFATGFRTGLEHLLEPVGLVDHNGNPRFPSGTATPHPGLYFMGYFDSLRGFLYESSLASRRLAQVVKSYLNH